MFKLVVLSVFLAVGAAKPGLLHSALVPAAVSHSSRVDIHSAPIAVAAPAVVAHAAPALIAHAAPAVVAHHIPTAVSHQSRVDIHQSIPVAVPALAAIHAVPAYHSAPLVHSVHSGHFW